MRYYITTTEDAQQKSAQEAQRRHTQLGTNYWWVWIVNHENEAEAAIQFNGYEPIPDDCQPTVDHLPSSWFPPESPERAAAEERERAS